LFGLVVDMERERERERERESSLFGAAELAPGKALEANPFFSIQL